MFRRKTLPPPLDEPKDAKRKLDRDLQVIYGDEGTTDFSKLETRKKSGLTRVLVWLLVTLAILSAAAWGGYLVFQKTFTSNSQTLNVSVTGPDTITSGGEAQFDITYQNIGSVPLANLEIKLNLPKGFAIASSNPAPTTTPNVWTIGSITPGSDGLIRLKGVWIDPVPSGQTIQAIASYKPANFNADFQQIATKAVAITASTLSIEASGPETAVPGTAIDYSYTIKNTGKSDLENVRLRLALPTSFIVSASDPAPAEGGTSEWSTTTLPANGQTIIKITGAYAADTTGLQTVNASIGLMRDQDYLEQAVATTQTNLIGGGLTLRLITNGSTDQQNANPGSTMRLSIDAMNGGTDTVEGLSVTLALTGSGTLPVDWSKTNLAGGTRNGNEIVWKSGALTKGGLLAANDRETIDLSLPLLSQIGSAADSFTMTVSATVSQIGSIVAERSIQSTPLQVVLNSDTAVTSLAHYFEDGTPVGTGPLPPTVGQTTRYRLYWTITNSLHSLDNASMTATLPPGVAYVGSIATDIGTLTFDPTSRIVSWKIDRLPTSVTHVNAAFDVSITPTSSQVAGFVNLTDAAKFSATDSKTKTVLTNTGTVITTELPDDAEAKDKGSVVAP